MRGFFKGTRLKMTFLLLIIWFLMINTGSQSNFLESSFQEIVYPTVISREEVRRKRSLLDIDDVSVFISIRNWTLKTKLNSALIIPSYFDIDWIHSNEIKNEKFPNCQAVNGFVDGNLHSMVILTICQQEFYGLLLIENRYLILQPLTNGEHLLFEDRNFKLKSNSSASRENENNQYQFRYEIKIYFKFQVIKINKKIIII